MENVHEKLQNISDYVTLEEMPGKICTEKSAAYYWDDEIYKIDSPCALFKIPEPITKFWTALYFKKNGHFTRIFNKK